jgi:hypothetical protein
MSEEEQERRSLDGAADTGEPGAEEEGEETSSPFDHPAFLPVLLWGLALWFGYDGFLNQDPSMLEHLTFNRGGFAVLVVLAAYFTVQSLREARGRSARGGGG